MKRIFTCILCLVMFISLTLGIDAVQETKVTVNGKQLNFDVPPTLVQGRTLVPLRTIFESLGAKIDWNATTKTVTGTKGNTVVILTVDKNAATVNGKTIELEVPGTIINNRTLVPARFIAEALGANVGWDGMNKTVLINSDSKVDDNIQVMINDAFKSLKSNAINKDGEIFLPLEETFGLFNEYIFWNEKDKYFYGSVSGKKLTLPIDKNTVNVSDDAIQLDKPAVILHNNTAMISVKFLQDYLEYKVEWDKDEKVVKITKEEKLKYALPIGLGKPKLSEDELKDLLGKKPEVIREKITTAYDLLQYMIVAGYHTDSEDTKITEGDYRWHHNKTGVTAVRLSEGNCGGTASFVNYLLDGDYEEVGFVVYSAARGQGGHVFNYIKHNNKYYVIDFLQYVMSDYKRYNYGGDVVNSLEEYPKYCIKGYGSNKTIKLVVAYDSEDVLPIANKAEGGVMMYFPQNTNVKVLYDTPSEDVTVQYIDGPKIIPEWDKLEKKK